MSPPDARRAVLSACTTALAAMVMPALPATRSTVEPLDLTSTSVPTLTLVPASTLTAPVALIRLALTPIAPLACNNTAPPTERSRTTSRLWLLRLPRSSTRPPARFSVEAGVCVRRVPVPLSAKATTSPLAVAPSCRPSFSRKKTLPPVTLRPRRWISVSSAALLLPTPFPAISSNCPPIRLTSRTKAASSFCASAIVPLACKRAAPRAPTLTMPTVRSPAAACNSTWPSFATT